MTQEEKELLLKDLCARLPYGVKIYLKTPEHGELIGTLDAIYPTDNRIIVDNLDKAIAAINVRCGGFILNENNVKPYLRPMSSMTKEEKKKLSDRSTELCIKAAINAEQGYNVQTCAYNVFMIDWLNAHHFDYRGLIMRGLAIEAPEGMYNIKEK